jgi:hypothetical protein
MASPGVVQEPDWKTLFELRNRYTSAHVKGLSKGLYRLAQPFMGMGFKKPKTFPVSAPLHNVVGAGIGYKESQGTTTSTLALIIYVERKLPKARLAATDLIPPEFEGMPTDVIETGRFYAAPSLAATVNTTGSQRRRPVQPGSSIGFQYKSIVMAGTLGAIVKHRKSQKTMLLSNNHVLCFESRLQAGAPIFQPGLLDGANVASDRVATLDEWTDLDSDNLDAAVAALDESTEWKPEILGFGRLSDATPLDTPQSLLGKDVTKSGRSTDLRTGTFKSFMNAYVDYAFSTRWFQHLILIADKEEPFAASGDSGSLIFSDKEKRPIGLLIARGDHGTLAHPLGPVLDKLQVDLVI